MNKIAIACIAILKYAIKNKCSIRKACFHYKKQKSFVSDYKRRGLERDLLAGKITQNQHDEIIELYEQYNSLNISHSNPVTTTKTSSQKSKIGSVLDDLIIEDQNLNLYDSLTLTEDEKKQLEYDAESDDKYDERSVGEAITDEAGKIIEYHYKILIRDEDPLEGNFTREEMDKIYRLYSNLDGAGLTLRAVSREFHNLTFRDFKRILRAFNITKASVPVAPHVLQEKTPDDIVQIIIRNKENIVLKKLDNERGRLFEKYLLDAQRKIVKYQKTEEWISEVIDRYFENKKFESKERFDLDSDALAAKNAISTNPTVCVFGDIHYGKKFDNPILGRAYNKTIAHERVMQIADTIVKDALSRNVKEIIMVCVGDLVESIMEDGMHPGHLYEMDLFQEEQIFYAFESLRDMIKHVLKNTNCPVQFHAVQGNHDRIGVGRDEDKNRTAGKIICKFLEREIVRDSNKIKFFIPKNNLLRIVTGKVMMFIQHGDSGLSKKKPTELVSLQGEPGCYSVLFQGHWHSLKSEEGNNYLAMKIPSVASTDKFILEELGNNNLPGFVIGHQPEDCYGFNYSKITLR